MKGIARRAFQLLTVRLVLTQFALALLVFLLSVIWLRMPDASVIEVAASFVLALLILIIASAGEASILLRLRSVARRRESLLRGSVLRAALILLIAVLLWFAWSTLLDHLSGNDSLRAGYLNSRFSHSSRYFFSYPHFLSWFGWLWTSLWWLGTGILLAILVAGIQARRPVSACMRVVFSASYWVILIACAVITTLITSWLLGWTPGHGLRTESVSLLLRLGTVIAIDLIVGCYALATITAVVERAEETHAMPTGTPDLSQPRTTDNP